MKILVIGAGASGIMFAIARKRSHPKDEIVVLEHLDKPLKKILATGNGKCNLGNAGSIEGIYNDEFASLIVDKYDFHTQREFVESLNIKTKLIDNLLYPISESAVTVRNALLKASEKAGIKIICNEEIDEYVVNDNYIEVFTKSSSYKCDKLVIASGGKSSPKLGSDGSIFNIIKEHRYQIENINPGLCPIYVKEKTKSLDGIRVKANVTLFKNDKRIHDESGEVLFKERGLSGIVIFNISRIIARELNANYKISIDLLPSVDAEDLGIFLSFNSPRVLLDSYLNPKLADYIYEKNLKSHALINEIKGLKFTFDKLYGFEFSQVSVGGILLSNVKDNLESTKEKNVYFLGECLNVDAPCGGYNLMWAFASALHLADHM